MASARSPRAIMLWRFCRSVWTPARFIRRVVLVSEKVAVYNPCNVARMTGVSLTSPVRTTFPLSCILPPKTVGPVVIVLLHLEVVRSVPHIVELSLKGLGCLLVVEDCSGVVLALLA